MGRLLALKDFGFEGGKEDPSWWFEDTSYYNSYRFDWEKVFKHKLSIHRQYIGPLGFYSVKPKQQKLRVEIRKFIERQCVGNVLHTFEEMDYNYLWDNPEPKKWDDKYRLIGIKHGYMHFHFEEEQDWIIFRITFGQYIRPVSERHPEYAEVSEEDIARAKDTRLHYKNIPDWTNGE